MAATDASPIPVKGQAYRVTFPILDADGDLVTAATGLDSEISKDGGTYVDCTNEATEIATGSGMYFLDLTGTEMNADTCAVIVKTTSVGAKTTPLILYPNKAGGLAVNVTAWAGTATGTGNVAIKNTLAKTTDITGFNDVSAAQVNTEADTALVDVGLTTTVTGRIDAAVSTRSTYAGADTSGTTTLLTRLPSAITLTAGKVDINDKSGFSLSTAGIDAVWAKTMTELSSVPGVTASTLSALQWIFLLARNKITQTSTAQVLRNDADSANIATSTVSDDGTTFTRGEFA
jgi:hypothetical protein